MADFDADTRVEGANGRYRGALSPDWALWGPSGGYVATVAMRAAAMEARIARPVSFSCHFLRQGKFAPVEFEVEVVQRGRRAESIWVVMRQEGKAVVQGLLRTAAEGPGLEHDVAKMPDVPIPEGLKSFAELFPDEDPPYTFWNNIEGRPLDPERATENPRVTPYPPHYREWYRFIPVATFDDVWLDAARSLVMIDTLSWPAASQPHPGAAFQAPNLDVTAWFHRSAQDSEWLLSDHEGPVAVGGVMGTVSRIWDRQGRLIATGGAQLLCLPVPPEARAGPSTSSG